MKATSLLRPRRRWVVPVVVLVLSAVTAQSASACIRSCVQKWGSVFRAVDGSYWEIAYCVQTETAGGPVVIQCYYSPL